MGADGPTSVFLAGNLNQIPWMNFFGLVMVILLLIPNVIYAVRFREIRNKCDHKGMNLLEQIGRYGCMFLMVFNIGIAEFGFSAPVLFLVYIIGSILLLMAYWVIWMLFFIRQDNWKRMALAVIPIVLFFLCGVTMGHILLVVFAIVFGIGHIYVTRKNCETNGKNEETEDDRNH